MWQLHYFFNYESIFFVTHLKINIILLLLFLTYIFGLIFVDALLQRKGIRFRIFLYVNKNHHGGAD